MPLTQNRQPGITLVLRYDDFSNGSPDGLDRFLAETAAASGVPLTVAAVPHGAGPDESRPRRVREAADGPLSIDKAALLAPYVEAGSIELAQHGYDHAAIVRAAGGKPAEFFGQEEAEQRRRIRRGQEILEERFGGPLRTFVPPWNRFDGNTLVALEALGFRAISAGRTAPEDSGPPERAPSLALIPATTPAHGVQDQVHAARAAGESRLIVGLLHPYDFRELATPWSRFEREEWCELMQWIAEQTDIATLTVGALSERDMGLDVERLVEYARFHEAPVRRLVPPSRPGSLDRPLGWYPSRAGLRAERRRRVRAATALHAGAAVLAVSGGWGLANLASSLGLPVPGVRHGLTGLAVLLVIRVLWREGPHFRGLLVTVAVAAMALGAWLS